MLCFASSKGCTEMLEQAVLTHVSRPLSPGGDGVLPVSRTRLHVPCRHPTFPIHQLHFPFCLAGDRFPCHPKAWKRQGCSTVRAVPKPVAHISGKTSYHGGSPGHPAGRWRDKATAPASRTVLPPSPRAVVQPCPVPCAVTVAPSFSFASTGLESVDHYPILVAVTGILVRLLVDTDAQG